MQIIQEIIRGLTAIFAAITLTFSRTLPSPPVSQPTNSTPTMEATSQEKDMSSKDALQTVQPVTVTITQWDVNLRSGPSTVHSVLRVYHEHDKADVYGQAHGDEWVLVKTSDGIVGWLDSTFLKLENSFTSVPYIATPESYVISGSVIDPDGKPYKGANLAIHTDSETRTDAYTDQGGNFFAYVPKDTKSEEWIVEIVGLPCDITNQKMDCSVSESMQYPPPAQIILPQKDPITFYVGRIN